jgi:DNA/RNA-binding protein KIN17
MAIMQVDEIMQNEKERRARAARADKALASDGAMEGARGAISGPWVRKGIAVKVMTRQLQDYFKKKGTILSVADTYVAEVQMNDSGDILRIDQAELETV